MTAFARGASSGSWGAKFALFVIASALAFLTAEWAVRWLFPQWAPRTARVTQFWKYDPQLGWSHRVGESGRFHSYGFDVAVSINSKGFRGPEIRYDRTPGVRRVLVIGDSLSWGYGVEFEESFLHLLQQRLPNTEIANLSVNGYSTDQELLLYRDEGRKYKADMVVLVVAENDFVGNYRTEMFGIYGKPAFVVQENRLELVNQPVAKPSWVKFTVASLAWHSYLLNAVNRYVVSGEERQVRAAGFAASNKEFPRSPAQKITMRLIREMLDDVTADGSQFLVVLAEAVPLVKQTAAWLVDNGIETVLLRDFIDPDDRSLYLLGDPYHWNAAGHQLVTSVLAETIAPKLSGLPG
jgi:hypothetical protein